MVITKELVLDEKKPLETQIRFLDLFMSKVTRALNGRLRFGTFTSGNTNFGENISGQFVQFTSHATPDTEFSVSHNLSAIPIGGIIVYQTKAGSLYQGPTTGTAWTATTVYFKCSVASVQFLVFLLK